MPFIRFSVALYSARRDEIEEVMPDAVEAIYSAERANRGGL